MEIKIQIISINTRETLGLEETLEKLTYSNIVTDWLTLETKVTTSCFCLIYPYSTHMFLDYWGLVFCELPILAALSGWSRTGFMR